MPTVPLSLAGPIDGNVPVASVDDVVVVWDDGIQAVPTAPVRDAIQAGQAALLLAYQDAAAYAAAQSDPLRATGEYLDEIGGEERGVFRVKGELDSSYGPRVNATPGVADPDDILAVVNAQLAPYTTVQARYLERADGMHLGGPLAPQPMGYAWDPTVQPIGASAPVGGWVFSEAPPGTPTTSWSCHLFMAGGPNAPPNYPDRLYPGATPEGLQSISNRRPGGARLFNDSFGRYFEIRAPDLSAIDATVSGLFDGRESTCVFARSVATAGPGVILAGVLMRVTADGIRYHFEVAADTSVSGTVANVPVVPLDPGPVSTVGGLELSLGAGIYDPLWLPISLDSLGALDNSDGFFLSSPAPTGPGPFTAIQLDDVASFLWSFEATSFDVYQAIINAVESIRGQSIRWSLFVDPQLTP